MNVSAFRFAPSPNGELHLGHAYSALLNQRMARQAGRRFLIRVEDIDTIRCTAELTRRALDDLAWLGLTWEQPVRIQSAHFADYRAQQMRLASRGLLYPCFCSRNKIAAKASGARRDPEGQPLYHGTCRALTLREIEMRIASGEPHAMRLDMETAVARTRISEALVWSDVILVRKDIGTSYHVAVVTDDHLQGITHVVRGRDLEAATPIHLLLQRLLGFISPNYHHHELIGDDSGAKLSKSEGAKSLRALREEGVMARDIRRALGFD
ncbi:MAG: tRNA glutamyl-Q(34) synthetase GluQRS [Aestuariivirga sp.]